MPNHLRHLLLALALLVACRPPAPPPDEPDAGLTVISEDPLDVPLRGVTSEQLRRFREGDALFGQTFRDVDGLGPLYIRNSCEACHAEAGKGPGQVRKMAVVGPDGVTPLADQSALPWGHSQRPYLAAGATTAIGAPDGGLPDGGQLLVTTRVGASVIGRGYLEAVADSEIERVEAEQAARTDGIHGRINRVTYRSHPNPDETFHHHVLGEAGLIGRFGHKARQPTLDDFAADAFQGDMGLTSPLRPEEPANPDGLTDDLRAGTDLDAETINQVANYMRLIELPSRELPAGGAALFDRALCSACHVPSLRTRADYPIPQLAGIDAPVYTDLLLHELGPELADGLTDESATSRGWRTAPLIGLRFMRGYLHDGRAHTLREAVLAHGGEGSEAQGSVQAFEALSAAEQQTLLDFVAAL